MMVIRFGRGEMCYVSGDLRADSMGNRTLLIKIVIG